jgi:CHAT domain-containing protein/Tfp pilus assembly protein PilF
MWKRFGLGLALFVAFGVVPVAAAQEGSLLEAEALNQQVLQLHQQGRFTDAIPLTQRVLAITEKVLGPDHPDTATALNNLAFLYTTMGAYAQAEPLYQRSLAIDEKVLGPEHPATATSLKNLAGLYLDTGAYAQAEPLYQRSLAIREKVRGPEHPDTAQSLSDLAELYQSTGAYAQAEPLLQRALAINEKVLGPEHPDTATSLANLALLYQRTGAYAQAEPLYRRALTIYEKVLGPEHPATATLLNNLAALYRATEAYAQVEPLYQRALSIYEKVLGPEHRATATSLNNLAGLYLDTGAYAQAEPLYQRSLAIREKVLGPEHPDTASALNNLALLYQMTGAYAQAEPLVQQALAIQEKVLGPEHPDTAMVVENLATLRWAMGEPTAALSLLERAYRIETQNLARFLLTGSESRKRVYLEQVRGSTFGAVSLSLALTSQPARALGLRSVLEVKGRVLDAMTDNVRRLRQSVKPKDRALLEQLVAVAQQLSTLIYQSPGSLSPEAYRQRVDDLSSKQTRLEAELSTRSAAFRQEVAPITLAAVQAAIPKQAALIEWYRYEPFDPKAKEKKTQWGKPRYVAYVLRHDGEPIVVDVGDAKAIEYMIQDFRTGLSDPTSTYVQELATDLSDTLLKPLRPLLGDTKHLLVSPDGALNLIPFAALRDEAGAYLSTKVEITYLTSGRDLLRVSGAGVAKGTAVVVANPDYGPSAKKSAKTVRQDPPAVPPARSLDLDRGGLTFTPLLGTAAEAQALSSLLKVKKEDLLTQAQATEAKVKHLHGPRILHIATHGFFLKDNEVQTSALRVGGFAHDQTPVPLGENPLLRSGLALAGANLRLSGEHDDGILTAAEVAQMDLRGTQLVVLSACETGLGDVQNGEGVYGLRRALVLAGAETQVASLWKVADDATKDLMMEYYQRLLQGEGRSAALRAAQRTMMTSSTRAHPYYWAAFIPIGQWTPLTQRR